MKQHFILVAIPPECIVFYVRSLCIANGVSDWAMVASPECPEGIFDFVNSLSADDFVNNSKKGLLLYPNPVKSLLSLKSDSTIRKIIISDFTGQVIKTHTTNYEQIKMYVEFVVEVDGTLSNFDVKKDLGLAASVEVITVLKTSPIWKPGQKDGRAVRSLYGLPIVIQNR